MLRLLSSFFSSRSESVSVVVRSRTRHFTPIFWSVSKPLPFLPEGSASPSTKGCEPGKIIRGSQPFVDGEADPSGKKGNGFDTLQKMGVKCRVLLRTTTLTDSLLDEKKELSKRNIKLYALPIPSLYFGPPAESILGHKIPDSARVLYTNAMVKA